MKQEKSTYNKFGKKMKELIELVKTTDDWEKYVENNTVCLINDLFKYQNLSVIMEKHNISYMNLRTKFLVAAKRIKDKDNIKIRSGKSKKAQHLFSLIESTPNWKDALTKTEIEYVTLFQKYKNFYAVARQLDLQPSNIAGKLYGTTQRTGVIEKLEKFKAL